MISREMIIQTTEKWIENHGLRTASKDIQRPWGAFWHIRPDDTALFLKLFFPEYALSSTKSSLISPKILLVLPGQRLSLQLHHRRAECWTVLQGPVRIVLGDQEHTVYSPKQVTIPVDTPHRLVGLEKPGLVSEIWIHEDPENPSTEEDIERLEDDYQRK
ncbi:phosphoheptose isomerase [bacterium]|nr:phosphoheptose isomerase [bacterium]